MKVLKEIRHEISAPLTYTYNLSLQLATLPLDWKDANMTAIHKKDKKTIPGNYHLISLTSIVCKILESIICDTMMNHFLTKNLRTNMASDKATQLPYYCFVLLIYGPSSSTRMRQLMSYTQISRRCLIPCHTDEWSRNLKPMVSLETFLTGYNHSWPVDANWSLSMEQYLLGKTCAKRHSSGYHSWSYPFPHHYQ
jgi:hypothetical protein